MTVRPFHYPDNHDGVEPKEFSIYLDATSKFSEKTDQNWSCLGPMVLSFTHCLDEVCGKFFQV